MESMQRRIMDELEAALKMRELDAVTSYEYTNRGTLYGMNEHHESEVTVDFEFNHGRAICGVLVLGEDTRVYRFVYTDGPMIRELIGAVRG